MIRKIVTVKQMALGGRLYAVTPRRARFKVLRKVYKFDMNKSVDATLFPYPGGVV